MMRANVLAAGGQILPDLTRTVCGQMRMDLMPARNPGSLVVELDPEAEGNRPRTLAQGPERVALDRESGPDPGTLAAPA
jgi:hypothetical protein